MNNTISTSGLRTLSHAGKTQQSGASQSQTEAASGRTGSASGASEHVNLTDSARALQHASRSGESSPVNAQKVAQIRQALDNGSYQINPARIADGLIRLDQQLGAALQGNGQS